MCWAEGGGNFPATSCPGRLSLQPSQVGLGKEVTHVAFVVHHLDLSRVAEFHHGPNGHIKLPA